jgi:hypothetical protein
VNVSQKFELLKERLQAKKSGDEWKAFCPNHHGKSQSLNFRIKNGTLVMICRGGCSTADVLAALGLDWKDFYPDPAPNGTAKTTSYQHNQKEVDWYPYTDESGKLLFESVRLADPKDFYQRQPNGRGGWIPNLIGVPRVLYHLPALKNATDIFITEGEKDVHTLEALGYVATTAPMGAKAPWLKEYSETLRGKNITILPDNDKDGIAHGQKIDKALHLISASTRIVMMPMGKDVTEAIGRGLTKEMLEALAADAPIFNPDAATEPVKDWRSLFHTFAEFESAPELSFLIPGFLQRKGITGLAALPGGGKTWLALSIVKALLFGPGKLWDLFQVNERANRVLYLIPESSLVPIKHRIKLMGLYEEIRTDRLLVHTIDHHGGTPELSDPLLLEAAAGADLVVLDTSVRFMEKVKDDSSAMSVAAGFSNDVLRLMRACPGAVLPLFHSPKSFGAAMDMTAEAMIRGSVELTAVLATAWGSKQLDEETNTLFLKNLKPRDFLPVKPFQLIGRPFIDREGDFRLHKTPDECGTLQEESPHISESRKQERNEKISRVRKWMDEEPNISIPELQAKFLALGVEVEADTIRRYRKDLRKEGNNE